MQADALSFAWRGRVVLRDVSLVFEPGDVIALHGTNGAGKTTFLRLLAGVLEPSGGSVRRGRDDDMRSAVSLVGSGDRGLYARLDVRANIELAVALALAPRAHQSRLVASATERFELGPLARQRVDRLSTGQRQRVRLALGFAADPQIVLLDEPAAGLDVSGVGLLAAALDQLAARGGAALWTAPQTGTPAVPLPLSRAHRLVDGRLRPA